MPPLLRPFGTLLLAGSRRWAAASVAIAVFVSGAHADGPKPDEEVTLYPTVASYDPAARQWVIPIHGCIYEPERDSIKRRALLSLLARRLRLDSEESALFRELARPFLVDHERGKVLNVGTAGGTCRCDPSTPNGQFRAELRRDLPVGAAPPTADTTTTLSIKNREGDNRTFTATAQLLAPTGISVIADIDDTVKVTDVSDLKEMLSNTFLRPYRAVPGMPRLLRALNDFGASIHYVSASPWQLSDPLQQMFVAEGLPAGSLNLKTFRWKDESFFDLFASPESFKPPLLRDFLERFPGRRFILIGDTSERDPEIYAQIAREFPTQVAAILIRIEKPEQWSDARREAAFKDVPAATVAFSDPSQVHAASVIERAKPAP